ncbi:hypothetical protein ARB_05039 [Paecilomyces variotii No. 5]|uniref:Uncharacterized protein n=1 Tax=Byssochlamys spectabilis (strain No. 5 / NBRC 109023) TaxID=1356009 RepID=V5GE44_BYSSN|nr:hypothetical protein ARB_05039 [Paecilomyces variotii No. 5]
MFQQHNGGQGPSWHLNNQIGTFPTYYGPHYGSSASQSEEDPSFSAQSLPHLASWGWPFLFHNPLNWPTGTWSDPGCINFQPYHDFSGNGPVPNFPTDNLWNRQFRQVNDPAREWGQVPDLPQGQFGNPGRTVTGTVEEVDDDEETQDHRSDLVETSSISSTPDDETDRPRYRLDVLTPSSSRDGSDRTAYRLAGVFPQPIPDDCCCCCPMHYGRCRSCSGSRCPRPNESDAQGSRQADIDAMRDLSRELKEEATNVRHERESFQRLNEELRGILEKMESGLPRVAEQSSRPSNPTNETPSHSHEKGPENFSSRPASNYNYNYRDSHLRYYQLDTIAAEFRRYDHTWRSILNSRENTRHAIDGLTSGYANSIPWPTPDLRMSSLSKIVKWQNGYDLLSEFRQMGWRAYRILSPQIARDPFYLQAWNAFCFFVYAFNMIPYYDEGFPFLFLIDHRRTRTGNPVPASRERQRLLALRAQLLHERNTWNPRHFYLAGHRAVRFDGRRDEIAYAVRAVWEATTQALRACEISLDCMKDVRMWI